MSVWLYSGTSTRQVCFIADISVWRVLFLGTMKVTDWTTQLKSYKKPNFNEQFMTGTFLRSAWKFCLRKPLYSGWYKETMLWNYCRYISKALLIKGLFHWYHSKILTIAIEHLVCGNPSKAMNHVLHYITPLKTYQARYNN